MMPLDSWIDEDALAMMRALTPKAPSSRESGTGVDMPLDFGLDPGGATADGMPEVSAPRIARSGDPEPGAIERVRQRLAEIRRRAESGGVVRAGRAEILPSEPVAPPESIDPAPAPDRAPECREVPAARPADPMPDWPAMDSDVGSTATSIGFPPPEPAAWAEEPAPSAPGIPGAPPTPVADFSPSTQDAAPDIVPVTTQDPGPDVASGMTPEPLPPAPVEIPDATVPDAVSQVWPRQPGPIQVPEGPLAVRLDAFRRWLSSECGVMKPVVFDRHGCPLHAAEGQNALVAAAVSLGTAWRDACALTEPPGTLRAVHSGWGGGTMAVIPVPTRFGDLYVAGLVQAAIEPSLAATIGAALRRAAGV